jgi:hypothetical protein
LAKLNGTAANLFAWDCWLRLRWRMEGSRSQPVMYGPSTVSAPVDDGGSTVRITQTTDYPFRERIEFRIEADGPVAFPMARRVPGWCSAPRLCQGSGARFAGSVWLNAVAADCFPGGAS